MLTLLFLKIRAARMMWPTMTLVMLLQRTPILRVIVQAEFAHGVRAGFLLRAIVPGVVATAVTSHTLTGATGIITNPSSPVPGTVGSNLLVAFGVGGSSNSPESYSIVGTLPPGMTVPDAEGPVGDLTLNASVGTIEGIPTTKGNYSVVITAFDSPDRSEGEYGATDPYTLSFIITGSADTSPTISVQPQPQTADIGGTAMFSVTASGSPTPTYQWRKDSVDLVGQTAPTITVDNVQASDGGDYTVVVSNSKGSVTSNPAALTVNLPAPPVITVNPVSMTSENGSNAFFSVQATGSGITCQWRKDGVALPGETNSTLFLTGVSAGDAGAYRARVTNGGGSVDSSMANLTVTTAGTVRFASLSTRAIVGTGGNVLIPGFFVGGTGQKSLLVRVVGEKLADFGVSGRLADPTLNVQRLSDGVSIASNDDWPEATDQTAMEAARAQVFAFELAPFTKDSSLLVSVPPGGYTATASGVNQTTGVALVEFYDLDPLSSTSTLTSISARAQVGTGGDILIPGISIQGNVAMTILIRAVGPTLGGFGVGGALVDPEMVLVRALTGGGSEVVTSNDDWEQSPDVALLQSATSQVSAFPLDSGSKDAAMLVVLNPGIYTIQVSGKNGETGVSLVELYRVAPGL